MSNEEIIQKAIEKHRGVEVTAGQVVCHPDNPFKHRFVRYDGEDAVVERGQGEVKFPRAEIFPFQKVSDSYAMYKAVGHMDEDRTFMVSL